jgi:AraC family transcriptional activator of pobA
MHYNFKDVLGGQFNLYNEEINLNKLIRESTKTQTLWVAWNKGPHQAITVDGIKYNFPSNAILPLMVNQLFQFSNPESIILWRFNREFYCIFDHDKEISCSGFLFYGIHYMLFIQMELEEQTAFNQLFELFIEEFFYDALLKGEMLRILLKRLLIKLTRLARKQYLGSSVITEAEFDTIRSFNLLVENHFREFHLVKQYAQILNISPKTLSNLFNREVNITPLEVIHNRILLEAKRLLFYTNKQAKEIAFDLGFLETSHFSRFFKNQAGLSPQLYKNNLKKQVSPILN